MKTPEPTSQTDIALARRLDLVRNRFEQAWRAGRPRIAEHLDGWHWPERLALLRELVLLDVEYGRYAGVPRSASDYLAAFPELDPTWLADALHALVG